MDMDFEVNKIGRADDIYFGSVRINGSKALCDKIRELCEKEFGEGNVA